MSFGKVKSWEEVQKINANMKRWEEEIQDFLFATWNWIEYCVPKREASIPGFVCNYIKFPKAENGRFANKQNLQEIIDTIENTDLSDRFFGPDHDTPEIWDVDDSLYIVWNAINLQDMIKNIKNDELEKYDDVELDRLFRY